MRPSGVITLTTDFGVADIYVGVMKGAIARLAPEAKVIDLTHAIDPYDVLEAAIALRDAYAWFPPGTVHVVVVDPGVGSGRGVAAMVSDGHAFLAPDTGILWPVAADKGWAELAQVTSRDCFLPEVGATFHGRDIFAPVAARMASGTPLQDLGPRLVQLQPLDLPRPERLADGSLQGVVLRRDRFGNLITSLTTEDLSGGRVAEVRVKGRAVEGLRICFADAAPGELLACVGSFGRLEIAVNQGNAWEALDAGRGDAVEVVFEGHEA